MSLFRRKPPPPDITPAGVTTAGFVDQLRHLADQLDDIADGLAEVHGVEPSPTIDLRHDHVTHGKDKDE